MKRTTILIVLIAFVSLSVFSQSQATYSVNFTSNWSQATHPHSSGNLPGNAHWSKLVGATHNDQVTFLEMGGNASPGIEDVAELGSNTAFFAEINSAISSGDSNLLIDGGSLGTAGGQINISNIVTTEDFPLLTLVSMIAPSPDWMIAVNGVELLDGNGQWKNSISIDLFPYDAGTDSGLDYTSPNNNTNPQDPINSAQGTAPFSSLKIGTLTITLDNVLGISDSTTKGTLQVFPNPATNNITVSNTIDTLSSIEIYNVIGSKVWSNERVNSNQLLIDISHLKSGVYLLRVVNTDGEETTKKVVKL